MKNRLFYFLVATVISVGMSSCGSKVFLITSGSENLRSLTKITDGNNPCSLPGGSVESNTLFFTMKVNNENNIYKKENPTAPAQIQVTSGADCNGACYCVATDRIAFSRQVNYFNSDIYMMPASKGNALIPVTETTRDFELMPSFSLDGKLLAYQKGESGNSNSEIWLKNLSTGENMLLGKGVTPSISPDGKKIAFAKIEASNSRNIWIMDIDGSNAQQLTVSKEEFAGFPKWSPSGKKIIFQSNKKRGNFDIFVMNADGTGLMQLTTNESNDLTPFWSHDGFIYIASDRGAQKDKYNIWRFFYED